MIDTNAPQIAGKLQIGISIRFIPAVYGWHPLNIADGRYSANIGLNYCDIRFPAPWDENGLTKDCRAFIEAAVRHAAETDGRSRIIAWPDETRTVIDRHTV